VSREASIRGFSPGEGMVSNRRILAAVERNRGHTVREFTDCNDAVVWVLSD